MRIPKVFIRFIVPRKRCPLSQSKQRIKIGEVCEVPHNIWVSALMSEHRELMIVEDERTIQVDNSKYDGKEKD